MVQVSPCMFIPKACVQLLIVINVCSTPVFINVLMKHPNRMACIPVSVILEAASDQRFTRRLSARAVDSGGAKSFPIQGVELAGLSDRLRTLHWFHIMQQNLQFHCLGMGPYIGIGPYTGNPVMVF